MKSQTVVCADGETIYSPFSEDKSVFVISAGYVLAYSLEADGKKRIHLIYGPGSYFPVITTFNQKAGQRASYEALTRVAVTKYRLADFVESINSDLEFSNQILQKTVAQLGIFADIVINLHTAKLEAKLLNYLRNLAVKHGQNNKLPYKLKHHQLADMLGAERETISRAMKALKKQDLVRVDQSGYLIIKPA